MGNESEPKQKGDFTTEDYDRQPDRDPATVEQSIQASGILNKALDEAGVEILPSGRNQLTPEPEAEPSGSTSVD